MACLSVHLEPHHKRNLSEGLTKLLLVYTATGRENPGLLSSMIEFISNFVMGSLKPECSTNQQIGGAMVIEDLAKILKE